MTETTKLAIVIEGGMIAAIVSNHPECFRDLSVMVIDYDTDGAEDDDLVDVPQKDDEPAKACAFVSTVERSGIGLAEVWEALHVKAEA